MHENERVVNLMPSNEILENNDILEGNIGKEDIAVFAGDFQSDDLKSDFLKISQEEIKEFNFIQNGYNLKINIPLRIKEKIKNVGIFFKISPNSYSNTLIAHTSSDTRIDDAEPLTLQFAVPREGESSTNTQSSMGYSHAYNEDDTESELQDYWKKSKLKKDDWHEEYIGQQKIQSDARLFINSEVANIAVSHNGNSSFYLLYQSELDRTVYMGIYESSRKKIIRARLTTTLKNWQAEVRNAIFTDTRKREKVRCFISHQQGVYCVDISLRDLSGSYQEVYLGTARVSKESTLVNFGGHPYLAGGCIGSASDGRHIAATGKIGTVPLFPVKAMWEPRNNPIVEYFNNNMYFIGGNINSSGEAVEIKSSPMPDSDFFYSATNIPLYESTFPRPLSEDDYSNAQLATVNLVSHAHCRVGHKIYIFPRNLFQRRNSPFYIYDTAANSISVEKTPSHIVDKVQDQNLRDYQNFQVVAVSNVIFFVLTKSSHTTLDTQILYWETN